MPLVFLSATDFCASVCCESDTIGQHGTRILTSCSHQDGGCVKAKLAFIRAHNATDEKARNARQLIAQDSLQCRLLSTWQPAFRKGMDDAHNTRSYWIQRRGRTVASRVLFGESTYSDISQPDCQCATGDGDALWPSRELPRKASGPEFLSPRGRRIEAVGSHRSPIRQQPSTANCQGSVRLQMLWQRVGGLPGSNLAAEQKSGCRAEICRPWLRP